MNVKKLDIPGVLLIEPRVFEDARGKFYEDFSRQRYIEKGICQDFVQENIAYSKKNVLRGLHYQKKFPQGKLISVLSGKVYDVILDLRKDSTHYGKYMGLWLDNIYHQQVYIPAGCAHGYYVVSDHSIFQYKCTNYYHPEDESGVMWNDSSFDIEWPLVDNPILSDKDKSYGPYTRE